MSFVPLDTETMGLCGPPILLQFRRAPNKPVELYNVWKHRVGETLELLEYLVWQNLLIYNATFDLFMLVKLLTLFSLIRDEHGADCVPETLFSNPRRLGEMEKAARDYDLTIRPKGILDLMLVAKKDKFARGMKRDGIYIKRIPQPIAGILCSYLNQHVRFERFLFSGMANPDGPQWKVLQSKDHDDKPIEGFFDVAVNFMASFSLKNIASEMGIVDEAKKFKDIQPDYMMMPAELTFAPFALAFENIKGEEQWAYVKRWLERKEKTKRINDKLSEPYFGTWLHKGPALIEFWETNGPAREYAVDDVVYLEKIYEQWGGDFDDLDSALTGCVAAARWKGFAVDLEGLKGLETENLEKMRALPFFEKTRDCHRYLTEAMDVLEKASFGGSTDDATLESLVAKGGEVGRRAQQIMDARYAKKEMELCWKLSIMERMMPSFNVVGALSGRMSGADGFNAHGVKRDKHVRSKFPLAFPGEALAVYDYSSMEPGIYATVTKDEKLIEDLKTGKKIGGLFGTKMFPPMTYEEIMKDKGKYSDSKSGFLSQIYGGNYHTLMEKWNLTEEVAKAAFDDFLADYPGAAQDRAQTQHDFTPMKIDEDGTGFFGWFGYKPYAESLFGYKRRFDEVEFPAAEALFKLATNLPQEIKALEGEYIRNKKKGVQSPSGLVMSALYGAIASLQSAVVRQAGNHKIQSTGSFLCKIFQLKLWELQPVGIHPWVSRVQQVHDENAVVFRPGDEDKIIKVKDCVLETYRKKVPLLDLEGDVNLDSWAEK
jgi:hypothetical protein